MSGERYKALLALFNEGSEDFWALPSQTLAVFFNRLYKK